MEAITSAVERSLVRMISRVCGRTNLILRSRSTSSLPEVSALVRTKSNGLDSKKASTATLSHARSIFQSGRMLATVAARGWLGPTTRMVFGEEECVSKYGGDAI